MRSGSQPVLCGCPKSHNRASRAGRDRRRLPRVHHGRGIGERTNDLQEFEDRSRPAMGDDERQGVRMTRANVHEVNVEPVDLSHELRQGIQLRLGFAPVIVRAPVAYESWIVASCTPCD